MWTKHTRVKLFSSLLVCFFLLIFYLRKMFAAAHQKRSLLHLIILKSRRVLRHAKMEYLIIILSSSSSIHSFIRSFGCSLNELTFSVVHCIFNLHTVCECVPTFLQIEICFDTKSKGSVLVFSQIRMLFEDKMKYFHQPQPNWTPIGSFSITVWRYDFFSFSGSSSVNR